MTEPDPVGISGDSGAGSHASWTAATAATADWRVSAWHEAPELSEPVPQAELEALVLHMITSLSPAAEGSADCR